jgi:hypothetical protein
MASIEFQQLNTVTVTAKRPKETIEVPNPLNEFASYTYSWSLWYLDTIDYNKLMRQGDANAAMNFTFSNKSFVLAQDGGIFPSRRVPGNPLNYNIQSVKFETAIGPGKKNRSSNMLDGSMTIIEPYGVTFIENLIEASFDGEKYNNYTLRPYMLQLEFKGYDDNGEPISSTLTSQMRRRFPIIISGIKVGMTNKGAEYTIDFTATGSKAFYPSNSSTPQTFSITAGTVGEFFKGLSTSYYRFFANQVFMGNAQWVESVDFEIDPAIANSSIIDKNRIPWTNANSRGKNLDLTKSTFSIPAGTPILDIITRIMSHSDYILQEQLKLDKLDTLSNKQKSEYDAFNAFKTTARIAMVGADVDGTPVNEGVIDNITNRYPLATTYGIRQFTTWMTSHPAMPKFSNSDRYTVKRYNYYYTGKNTDIIDLKLDFDTTYYSAMLGYTNSIAAENATQTTAQDDAANDISTPKIVTVNPAAQLAMIPNITPIQYRRVVNNPNTTIGMNVSSRPAASIAADVLNSIFTSDPAAAITLELTITGDPMLIKQDDWAYIPSPLNPTDYNNYDTVSQDEFARRYGHLRMDTGDLVALVLINTPMDIDTDTVNQGLVDPIPGYSKSLFSGRYRILTISNTFANGKFEQKLTMARYINDDLSQIFNTGKVTSRPASNAVTTSQNNQVSVTGENQQQSTGTTNTGTSGDSGTQQRQ